MELAKEFNKIHQNLDVLIGITKKNNPDAEKIALEIRKILKKEMEDD